MAFLRLESHGTGGADTSGHLLTLKIPLPVRILDISLSGVLLASPLPLRVGDRAELTATIGARAVLLPVEIRRVSVDRNSPREVWRYRAAAVWTPACDEDRAMLARFINAK
jgi:hypothetical protein